MNLMDASLKPSTGSFWLWRAAAQLDSDVDLLFLAEDGELDDVAGFQAFDGFSEVGDGTDFFAIDGNDQVSGAPVEAFEDERPSALTKQGWALDASWLSRTVRSQAFDQQTLFCFEDSLDADFCSVDATVGD